MKKTLIAALSAALLAFSFAGCSKGGASGKKEIRVFNIKVEIVEKQHIRTHMDPTLASSLVNNLLKNAFVHNKKDGCI